MRDILRNSIRTPDGTELISEDRHDYNHHKDANGNYYAVDGGLSYLKRNFDVKDYEETSVYYEDPISITRGIFKWGTYGKDGKQPFTKVLLEDLTTEHIYAIIETQRLNSYVLALLHKELEYRVNLEGINSDTEYQLEEDKAEYEKLKLEGI